MANPNNFQFVLLKTQGQGTNNGRNPVDITNRVRNVGMTYVDTSNRMRITRTSGDRIQVVFSSGLFFDLTWRSAYDFQYGNAEAVKILQKYVPPGESRGIMGSTPFQDCEL